MGWARIPDEGEAQEPARRVKSGVVVGDQPPGRPRKNEPRPPQKREEPGRES